MWDIILLLNELFIVCNKIILLSIMSGNQGNIISWTSSKNMKNTNALPCSQLITEWKNFLLSARQT